MIPKESWYTFLAGVAVALVATLLVELNPHLILTSDPNKFRSLLAASLVLFGTSPFLLFKAAAEASAAAQQRVDRNLERLGTAFDADHNVDAMGWAGAGLLACALCLLIADHWFHTPV